MTDVDLRGHLTALIDERHAHVLALFIERDKALALLASDLTRRLDQTYVTFQGLQGRLDGVEARLVLQQQQDREAHHALARTVAGVVSRHEHEAGRSSAWATIGAYAVGVAGLLLGIASLAISLGAIR